MRKVYIVDAVRTPVGKFGKSLKDYPASDLAAFTIKKLLERVGIEPSDVDFVVMGHAIRAGTGMNTARQAALKAGLPPSIGGMTIDMVCASGMAAIITAAQFIMTGAYDVIVAGGMESMSQAPFLLPSSARWGLKHLIMREANIQDAMVHDGLYDILLGRIMGEEADAVAKEFGATREILDWIAYESHRRAAEAWDKGYMKRYVEPFTDKGRVILDYDEGIRKDTSLEKLSKLPPAFWKDGFHTAGSSSQLSDGAASLLIASEDAVKSMGLKPKAEILGFSYAAVETWKFPYAPVEAIKKLLKKLGWTVNDVDYWENNEAFAVNSFLVNKFLGIPYEKLNVHGGAIAIGHPLGMSGARVTIELLNVLEVHGGERGIASICHGLGGATAIAIRRL
ncbi:thiolase family protein [Stetteria hydrogenophila]